MHDMSKNSYLLGELYYLNDKYKSAINYLQEAMQVMKKAKVNDYRLLVIIYYHLGMIFSKNKNYREAAKQLYKAKQIIDTWEFKDSTYVIFINLNLGYIYFEWSWLDEALKYFNLCKESLQKSKEFYWSHLWEVDFYIGIIYYKKGDKIRSLEILERLFMIISNSEYKNVQDINYFRINYYIALIYIDLGNFEKSTPHTERCLQYLDSCFKQKFINYTIIFDIYNLCYFQRNYSLCESICLKSLKMCSADKSKHHKFIIYKYLLETYDIQGNYEKVDEIIEYLEANITYADNKSKMRIFNLIGRIHCDKEDFTKADIYLKKAEDILENNLKADITLRGDLYLSIGLNYSNMGRLEESEYYYKKALNAFSNIDYNVNGILDSYNFLAHLNGRKANWKMHKHYLLEYVKLCKEKNVKHPEYFKNICQLVNAHNEDDDIEMIYELLSEVVELQKQQLTNGVASR